MNLFSLSKETTTLQILMEDWASAHDGDITEFPFLDSIEELYESRESAALSCADLYKNLVAEASAIKAVKQELGFRQAALERKAERLKESLEQFLDTGEKYSNGRHAVGWRKSTVCQLLVEPAKLPIAYQKIEVSARLAELKADLKASPGEKSIYAVLVEKNNIQIK